MPSYFTIGTLNVLKGVSFDKIFPVMKYREKIIRMLAGDIWLDVEQCEENIPVQEMGFEPEKCLCCIVEGGQTLVHGPGGRGYGLGNTAISSGY